MKSSGKNNSFWIHGADGSQAVRPNAFFRGFARERNDDVADKPLPPQHDVAVGNEHSHGKKYPGGY